MQRTPIDSESSDQQADGEEAANEMDAARRAFIPSGKDQSAQRRSGEPVPALVPAVPSGGGLCPGFLALSYLAVDPSNLHDKGAVSISGVFNGVRLFLVSRLLNPDRSSPIVVFHALTVAVYSLQPDSHVSISALVGGMSIPFWVSGPRTE